MKLQKLLSTTRQAIDDYNMIRPGDKICVAVSGGKDSLTLLEILANLRKVYDNTFSLEAITVNLGYEESDFSHINRFCEKLNINYTVVDTQIAKIVFEERQEKKSMFLMCQDATWCS